MKRNLLSVFWEQAWASHKILVIVVIALGVYSLVWVVWPGSGKQGPIQEVSSAQPTLPSPSFDVPSLLGKSVDQVRVILSEAQDDSEPTALQLQVGIDSWDNTWEKDGQALIISYNPNTRKINNFFIGPSTTTSDTNRILAIGNLSRNDPRYRIKFISSRKGDGYTGVTVIPN